MRTTPPSNRPTVERTERTERPEPENPTRDATAPPPPEPSLPWDPAGLREELQEMVDYAERFHLIDDGAPGAAYHNTAVSTVAELARGSTAVLDFGTNAAKGWERLENAEDGWDYALAVSYTLADLGEAAGILIGAVGGLRVVSRIKENKALVKFAKRANKSNPRCLTNLKKRLEQGNLQPGKGNRGIGGLTGVVEARTKHGGRLLFRKKDDVVEILGETNKNDQKAVIELVGKTFGL